MCSSDLMGMVRLDHFCLIYVGLLQFFVFSTSADAALLSPNNNLSLEKESIPSFNLSTLFDIVFGDLKYFLYFFIPVHGFN